MCSHMYLRPLAKAKAERFTGEAFKEISAHFLGNSAETSLAVLEVRSPFMHSSRFVTIIVLAIVALAVCLHIHFPEIIL